MIKSENDSRLFKEYRENAKKLIYEIAENANNLYIKNINLLTKIPKSYTEAAQKSLLRKIIKIYPRLILCAEITIVGEKKYRIKKRKYWDSIASFYFLAVLNNSFISGEKWDQNHKATAPAESAQ